MSTAFENLSKELAKTQLAKRVRQGLIELNELEEEDEEPVCELCHDYGFIEFIGSGPNFEEDVIGTKLCECQHEN